MAIPNGTHHPQPPKRILIVGAGPVGLLLAIRLAQAKIPITLFESQAQIEKQSKAIVYMPPIYPELKRAGVLDAMFAAGTTIKPPVFRRTDTKEVLVAMPESPVGGGLKILLLPQWRVQEIFLERGKATEGVDVRMGSEVVGVDDSSSEGVKVRVRSQDGSVHVFEGDYLIGADGGRSFVRKAMGIPFEGITLPHQLVATDVRYPFEMYGYTDTQFMLDAEDYGVVSKIDDKGLWRVSFGVKDGATREEIEDMVPKRYEAMFPGPRPLEYEVVNVAPYRCQQLCAKTMRNGRVSLIGDAAHLTNPYSGLGLTTGFFDAASLADCLINIIQSNASPPLLDAWSEARINVFQKIVDPMSRAAFFRTQDPDLDTIVERDPMFRAAKNGKMMHPPSLATSAAELLGFAS